MNRVSSALICLALTPATGAIAQQLVTELNSAPAWQFTQVPRLLQCDGQRVFGSFQSPYGEQGLFVSDGTAAGSRVHTSFTDQPGNVMPCAPIGFVGGEVVFGHGTELWITAATATGIRLLKNGVIPGNGNGPLYGVIGELGNALLFGDHVGMLWRTDGTVAGTSTLAGVTVGRGVVNGNQAIFAGLQGGSGWELWRTDGTVAGTRLVVDLVTNGSSHPTAFATLAGVVHFLASESNGDAALWRTDGTAAGTVRIRVFPGFMLGATNPTMVENGGYLLFAVGSELWRSDGTTAGTVVVRSGLTAITRLATIGGKTYFAAVDGPTGMEAWCSDGTAAGTQLLIDLTPGQGWSVFSEFVEVGGEACARVVTGTGWGVLFTDGTPAGSRYQATASSAIAAIPEIQSVGGVAVFGAVDGVYGSDGTVSGTQRLLPLGLFHPGIAVTAATALGDVLLFAADDGSLGRELWRTDGTAAGTARLTDIVAGPDAGLMRDCELVAMDGHCFVASGDVRENGQPQRPSILFRTDGTAAGTIALTQAVGTSGGAAHHLQVHDHQLYFSDLTPNGLRLFRTDGLSPPLPLPIIDLHSSGEFLVTDDFIFYVSSASSVWRTDLTVAGTVELSLLTHRILGAANGRVFLQQGQSTIATDGTVAGTVTVSPLNNGVFSEPVGTFAGHFYWTESGLLSSDRRLMRSDGTVNGTAVVATVTLPLDWVIGDNAIYFTAHAAASGRELWQTDGTAAGTGIVVDLFPGPHSSVRSLTGYGNRLLLAANDGIHGLEPWTSDGTGIGTAMLIDGNPNGNSQPLWIGGAGGRAYLALDDGNLGRELWQAPVGAFGAAIAQPFGRGCAGGAGLPELTAVGLPRLGGAALPLAVDRVPAGALTAILFGTDRIAMPLPSGCVLWPAGATAAMVTTANLRGTAAFALSIPVSPGLLGVELTGQAAAIDAFGGALPGVSSSNGLILVVGA